MNWKISRGTNNALKLQRSRSLKNIGKTVSETDIPFQSQ